MRFRSLVLALLAAAGVFALLRRRSPVEFVDVQFDDSSAVRLTAGPEARDLLDDAHMLIEVAS